MTLSQQIEDILLDIAASDSLESKQIVAIDDTHIQIKDQLYEVVLNYRDGFQLEAFEARYQDFFEKFDFIVGDWGFEQLRLRGFYQMNHRKAAKEQTIDYLDDYLKEYCNFGCQYFVLAKEAAVQKYTHLKKTQQRQEEQPTPAISRKPISTRQPKQEMKPAATKAMPSFKQKKRTDRPDKQPIEAHTTIEKRQFTIKKKSGDR